MGAVGSVCVLGLAAFAACGGGEVASVPDSGSTGDGSSRDGETARDGGRLADATLDAAKPCAIDADLGTLLQVDAAGVDSGGIDLAACLGCINTNCSESIMQCNGDCVCKQGVSDFIDCTTKNPSQFQQCGLQLYTNLQGTSAQGIGQGLLLCAGGKCKVCIPSDGGGAIVDSGGKG